jgi:hypothetical protein
MNSTSSSAVQGLKVRRLAAGGSEIRTRGPTAIVRSVSAMLVDFQQGARDFHSRDRCGIPIRLVPEGAEFKLSVPTMPFRARSIPVRVYRRRSPSTRNLAEGPYRRMA